MHQPTSIDDVFKLTKLWFHESCRVFQDRLINDQDREWFANQLKDEITNNFKLDFSEVAPEQPIIFADFCNDAQNYQFVDNHKKMIQTMTESLDDYNQVSTAQMKLVLFIKAILILKKRYPIRYF